MDPSRPPAPDDVADLARRVYEASHLTGSFVLRSGATSGEYFDKYRFESDPRLLRGLAEAMAGLLADGAGGLAGLELGGVPLATVLSQVTGLPAGFVRKQGKPYRDRPPARGLEGAGPPPPPAPRPPAGFRAQAAKAVRAPPPGRGPGGRRPPAGGGGGRGHLGRGGGRLLPRPAVRGGRGRRGRLRHRPRGRRPGQPGRGRGRAAPPVPHDRPQGRRERLIKAARWP